MHSKLSIILKINIKNRSKGSERHLSAVSTIFVCVFK